MSERYELHHGDCLDILRTLPDNSIDAVVTDPPYGLAFMGKKWDYDVPSEDIWRECLRVLKPGGHLLAFAGTRTQHRMAVRIEDAGFEIRDMIAWVYGSGFPKSLDVSKAIDKRKDWKALAELGKAIKAARVAAGLSQTQAARLVGLIGADESLGGGGFMWFETGRLPTRAEWPLLKHALKLGDDFDAAFEEAEREVVKVDRRQRNSTSWDNKSGMLAYGEQNFDITAPATDAARQWHGWGTALKPALEPITVARKPLIGTVAANVLTWGTGGVNVDASRVGGKEGRWPANLIHDGSEEVVRLFPESKSGIAVRRNSGGCTFGSDTPKPQMDDIGYGDTGSAARFFYCAKASKADRGDANHHPTVKPTDLMRYLCRLVTPPNGIVLDPFMGSGSTGKAAILEGFRFVGIEREAEYIDIARARIQHDVDSLPNTLFDNTGE